MVLKNSGGKTDGFIVGGEVDHERVLVDCIDRFTSILVVGLMLLLAHDMFLDNATHAKMFTSHAVYDNIFQRKYSLHPV